MSKLNKIKEMLQTMLMQFSQLSTDKGLISWDGDGELPEVGVSIVVIDEEGNEVKAESGEYRADNGNIIVIEDGVVSEVREEEKPVEEPVEEPVEKPVEEPMAEPMVEPEPKPQEEPIAVPVIDPDIDEEDVKIAELEAKVKELETENEQLRAKIKELEEKPAVKPASEEFERINHIERPKDKKLGRLYDIINAKEQ